MTFMTEISKRVDFFYLVFWNKHKNSILTPYVNVDCERRRLKADYSLQTNNLLWQVGIILLV